VIAATSEAVAADSGNAQVVFRAAAMAHDAVASTVTLGRVEGDLDVQGFFGLTIRLGPALHCRKPSTGTARFGTGHATPRR
jgi:hypothetical protein